MAARPVLFRMDTEELVYLAGILGARVLIGVPDPFRGWTPAEAGARLRPVQERLSGRRFLQVRADGGVIVDAAVALVVSACAFSSAVWVQTYTAADGSRLERHFHIAPQLVVEKARVGPEAAAAWELAPLPGPAAAARRVVAAFRLGGRASRSPDRGAGVSGERDAPAAPADIPGGLVREEVLRQAGEAAARAGVTAAASLLAAAGLPAATAAAMAETLARPAGNGALAVLRRRHDGWQVDGLGLLRGGNGLWQLRPRRRNGEKWVAISPSSPAAARAAVLGLLGVGTGAAPAAGKGTPDAVPLPTGEGRARAWPAPADREG